MKDKLVNVDKIPEKYKHLVKPVMTRKEVQELGRFIMAEKWHNLKKKLMWWKNEKRD